MIAVFQIRIIISNDCTHDVGKQYGENPEDDRELFHGIPPKIFCALGATMHQNKLPKYKGSEK